MACPLDRAFLESSDRARAVHASTATPTLKKLRRLYRLALAGVLPSWLGDLRHLRVLTLSGVKAVPASVFVFPRLRERYLDDTRVTSLDGLERSPSLETISLSGTPLGKGLDALAAVRKRVKGATDLAVMTGVSIARPKGKGAFGQAGTPRGDREGRAPLRRKPAEGGSLRRDQPEQGASTHDVLGSPVA